MSSPSLTQLRAQPQSAAAYARCDSAQASSAARQPRSSAPSAAAPAAARVELGGGGGPLIPPSPTRAGRAAAAAAEEDVSSAIASSAVRFITLCASAITVHILANLIITEQKGNGNSSVISSFLYHNYSSRLIFSWEVERVPSDELRELRQELVVARRDDPPRHGVDGGEGDVQLCP